MLTALEKNPDHRFTTAGALESAVAGRTSARRSSRSRQRVIRGMGIVVVLAAVALIAVRLVRPSPKVAPAHVPDAAAADLVKTANFLVKDRTPDHCTQAIRMLSRATAADSLYAEAWASLAKSNALCALFGDGDPDVMFAAALGPAKQALELDPRGSDSHTTLGMVHLFHEQAFDAARQEFVVASQLDSTKYEPWLFRAWTYVAANQLDSAVYSMRQAKRLRPVGDEIVGVRLATILRKQGRYADAQSELDQVLQVNPTSGLAGAEQFEFHVEQHQCLDASADAPTSSRYYVRQYMDAVRAARWVYCDNPERARRYVTTLVADTAGGKYVDEFALGGVYAVLGDTARMFRALHAAVAQHNWALFFLHNHFFFRQYYELPEYRAIMTAAHVK